MTRKLLVLALSLATGVTLLGCGKGGGNREGMPVSPTVPVTGIVRYQGKPVGSASITLQSLDGKIFARGNSDAAGVFNLSTYKPQDGAPPGKYKVMVAVSTVKEIAPGVLAPEPEGGFKSPIPTKYADFSKSDILVDVKESGKNELLIDLK
ncbi:MAG: carboxypeptidase-like regulatory domain-containing protein [Gemmataceae bacterium]